MKSECYRMYRQAFRAHERRAASPFLSVGNKFAGELEYVCHQTRRETNAAVIGCDIAGPEK